MREDIHFFPAGEIQARTGGEEIETGLGESGAAFTRQHLIQRRLQLMQIGDVIGGISQLAFRQLARPPIRRLLLLGELNIQKPRHGLKLFAGRASQLFFQYLCHPRLYSYDQLLFIDGHDL